MIKELPRAVLAGAALWVMAIGLSIGGLVHPLDYIDVLLILGPLVMAPLAFGIIPVDDALAKRVLNGAMIAQPWCAAAALASFFVVTGGLAGSLAAVWLIPCGLAALAGLILFIRKRSLSPAVLVPAGALAYLLVGGIWLMISQAGMRPLHLHSDIVELTAVHFHYAGLVLLTMSALTMRAVREHGGIVSRIADIAGMAALIGAPMVAIGFVVVLAMLVVGAVFIGIAAVTIATITLVVVAPRVTQRASRVMLSCSSLAIFLPMVLAVAYALARLAHTPALTIEQMAYVHGSLNAFGFSLLGLLGWFGACRRGENASERGGA